MKHNQNDFGKQDFDWDKHHNDFDWNRYDCEWDSHHDYCDWNWNYPEYPYYGCEYPYWVEYPYYGCEYPYEYECEDSFFHGGGF